VPQAVVEQVQGKAMELVGIAVHRHGTVLGDRQPPAVGDWKHLRDGGGRHLGQVALPP
jgi:hypothetical protein